MISLKKSAYNIFIPYDNNQWIIFNSFSGALGLFDEQTKNRFDLGTLRDDETQTLLEKGILIASSRSELNEINADRANGILSKNNIHFRIWPTSVCNANCFYCFEQGIKHEVMKRSTAEQLLKFIDEKTPKDSNLYIEWFGGEPLCNVDLIDYISHGIKDICNKKT